MGKLERIMKKKEEISEKYIETVKGIREGG